MKRPSIGEVDVSFGQIMLTLRSALDLTQAELARQLEVSRRAIGEWEAGNSYPKADHLKHFIELAVRQQAFRAGQEAQEIRRLWKEAHQKVLLDEPWLQALLTETSQQDTLTGPFSGEEVSAQTPVP